MHLKALNRLIDSSSIAWIIPITEEQKGVGLQLINSLSGSMIIGDDNVSDPLRQ